ncbi:MAG: tetratricopeptide repeat protein [Terriglobia bacterium]
MTSQAAGRRRTLTILLAIASTSSCLFALPLRKHGPSFARVEINAERPGCAVDIDGTSAGKTSPQGDLLVGNTSPSAHYIHLDCPNQPEKTWFISPQPGALVQLKAQAPGSVNPSNNTESSLDAAERNLEVRALFREEANFRSNGQFPEAIDALRRAIKIDPENPNLHYELGATLLMIRDWEDARVELLEAIRHDPNSADLHNGLGYALEKLGEIRPALHQFRLARRLDPTDTSYRDQYFEALGLLAAQQAAKKKK